ncbi:uncharacterized protein LOC136072282 [Hydra vulgaris]|uniref:uncharacterized protein LOC136072282 n=1 Tax=Hydra vulgaris TaxID=6087 RepID=UPI0032E9D801
MDSEGHRLPKDKRTLLQTPKSVVVESKCGGQYYYFGLETGSLNAVSASSKDCLIFRDEKILIDINIDGLPLFRSTSMNLWSILCRIVNSKPFIVALYYGKSKPSNIYECMLEFLNEYKQPQLDGIYFGQKKYNVVIRALICDAPARAFIKGIVNHNGYNACERCTVKGVWNGRVIYKNHIVQDLRTDEKFNEMGYKAHQITISPLISINVKCVQEFSLDYMHLVCLGVVRLHKRFSKTNMWKKAVWKEDLQEEEGVIPSNWIGNKTVYWPPGTKALNAMKAHQNPEKNWLKILLIKIKFSLGITSIS